MGFGQGLSGLKAASQSLDIIGNNIANSGTVGFKAASATFADVYANSRVGLGVQVASVNQRFAVGNVSTTGNQFDIAINGEKGFFRVVDTSGNVLYTRNGQFFADAENYIVNAQGHRLTGFPQGGTTPQPITVPVGNIPPQATSGIQVKMNFDANAEAIPATVAFDPEDASSFTHSLPIDVYDSLGNAHQLTQYFVKRDAADGASQWHVYYALNGERMVDGDGALVPPTTVTFDDAGRLTAVGGAAGSFTAALQFANPGGTNSPAEPLQITVNYADSTQFGGPFATSFVQNGHSTGEYASMSIADDGSIVARYTNGESRPMGSLVLADFKNLQGLQPVGGNAWQETSASGQPVLGVPGTNGLATLMGQAVEDSNVDMSQELVNMIIAQRTYQANAQTIKTQDQILQTLITMR